MCKKFEGWNMDSRLRYFVAQAEKRIFRIAGRFLGPKFLGGLQKYDGDEIEKSLELNRRFLKNQRWADYCQNRRYELRGL